MSERPDYVIACKEIAAIMYPNETAVGLQITDPAGQKLFISLPGGLLRSLGEQLQEFADEHPEVTGWQPVQFQSQP